MTGGVWCIVCLWYVISLSVIIITRKICVQQAHTVCASVGDLTAVVGMVGVINKCSADIRSVLAVHKMTDINFRLTRRNDKNTDVRSVDGLVFPSPKWFSGTMPNVRNIKNQFIALKRSTKHKVVMCKNHFVSLDIEQIPTMVNIVRELPKHSGESDLDQVSRTTLGLRNYIGYLQQTQACCMGVFQ